MRKRKTFTAGIPRWLLFAFMMFMLGGDKVNSPLELAGVGQFFLAICYFVPLAAMFW